MSSTIKLRRSAVAGKQPNTSIMELGEVAINTTDGKMFFKRDDTGNTSIMSVVSTNTQTSTTDVTGDLTVTGTLTGQDINSSSDITLKENIVPLDHGIKTVQAINPVSFTWKDGSGVAYGVIAQEIENTIPAIVSTNDDGIKSVSYIQLISFLIKAVQEQQEQIEELKSKL